MRKRTLYMIEFGCDGVLHAEIAPDKKSVEIGGGKDDMYMECGEDHFIELTKSDMEEVVNVFSEMLSEMK